MKGNFSTEMKIMFKNGNVEIKTVITGTKSLFEGFNRELDRAE